MAITRTPLDDNSGTVGSNDGEDAIVGDGGDNTLRGDGTITTLVGDSGNDGVVGADGDVDETLVGDGNGGVGAPRVNGRDWLKAQGGDDTLSGGAGKDRLAGGDGDDFMHGGNGKDRLYGGEGDDVLVGGNGNDVMYGDITGDRNGGATGSDIFVFDNADGNDKVFDFVSGTDKVGIQGDLADVTLTYNAGSGNTKMTYGDTTVIFYDEEVTMSDLFLSDGQGNDVGTA